MIYSRSVEYAIRALMRLAVEPLGTKRMAREIAEEQEIPAFFLAKTLQQLARKGLLRSVKGPTGGFGLNRRADRIALMDIVEALDGADTLKRCVLGLPDCTERKRCAMDRSFDPIRRDLIRYLTKTTIADLAAGTSAKRGAGGQKKRGKKALLAHRAAAR